MAMTNFSSFMQFLLFHYFFLCCALLCSSRFFVLSLFIFLYSHYAHKLCEIYLLSALKKHTAQDIYTQRYFLYTFICFFFHPVYLTSPLFSGCTNLVDCKNSTQIFLLKIFFVLIRKENKTK